MTSFAVDADSEKLLATSPIAGRKHDTWRAARNEDRFFTRLILDAGCNSERQEIRAVRPMIVDYLGDGRGGVSPFVLMGFHGSEAVYRVTNTLGLRKFPCDSLLMIIMKCTARTRR